MPGLNWKVIDVSLLFLGQLAYRLCLALPALLHTHFLTMFPTLTPLNCLCLLPKTHATVLQVCFHSNNFSDACESLNKRLTNSAVYLDTWRSYI